MTSRALILLAILVSGIPILNGTWAQSAPLWAGLEKGAYDTGFDRIWTVDQTRPWSRRPALDSLAGEIGRPIRIDIWYPAECGQDDPMALLDYVVMEPPTEGFSDLVFLANRWDEYSFRGLAEDSTSFEQLMAAPTAACRRAPEASGRFPIVAYSAGWFNRTPDNSILAEYLASHGFVVVAVPQLNPGLWTFNFRSDAQSVENQTRDLEFAISEVSKQPYADRRKVAAMGYSTGGDVALLLAGRNPLIDAVVGLDASWTLGENNDVINTPFFRPSVYEMPVLAIRRPSDKTAYDVVIDSLKFSPRLVVEVPSSDHGSFSDDPGQRSYLGADNSSDVATHGTIANVTRLFLTRILLESAGLDTESFLRELRSTGAEVAYHAPESVSEGGGE